MVINFSLFLYSTGKLKVYNVFIILHRFTIENKFRKNYLLL